MVRITAEVGRGTARYRVAVQAGSFRRALEIVEGLSPYGGVRAPCPADFGVFLDEDPAATAESIEQQKTDAASWRA